MNRYFATAVLIIISVGCGPTSIEEPSEPMVVGLDTDSDFTESALGNGQSCTAIASGAASIGIIVSGVGLTASCAGVFAVTGPGTVVCLAPAAATGVAALVGTLSAAGAYLSCINSQGNEEVVPLVNSRTCSVGSATFCRQLVKNYKGYCGQDVFRSTSQISCSGIDLRPATATAAKCDQVAERIKLGTGCLTGRKMMRNFIEQGLCPGSGSDPEGAGHDAAIRAANDKLAECKSKYKSGLCGNAQAIQAQTAKDFARNTYLCQ
jgi:hypothetical protein